MIKHFFMRSGVALSAAVLCSIALLSPAGAELNDMDSERDFCEIDGLTHDDSGVLYRLYEIDGELVCGNPSTFDDDDILGNPQLCRDTPDCRVASDGDSYFSVSHTFYEQTTATAIASSYNRWVDDSQCVGCEKLPTTNRGICNALDIPAGYPLVGGYVC